MTTSSSANHKSGFLEISSDEPKGTLVGLLRAAKEEEKILLTEVRTAVKYSRRATSLVKQYKKDLFGESFGVKGRFGHRRFKRLINESLQLATSAKVHLPAIEMVANEVKDWLLKHKTDKTTSEILPEEKKIIDEVRKAKELLELAVTGLTELNSLHWGSAPGSSFFAFRMYYIPVEQSSSHEVGLKFRSDWIKPLKQTNNSLAHFANAVENIFKLQNEINKKYRI